MRRRDFLATAAGLLAARTARAAQAHIEVFVDEPFGTISPDLHGHFTEHIGGVVYDGIWVGEDSKIPNIGGIRASLVEALRTSQTSRGPLARRLFRGQLQLARRRRASCAAAAARQLLDQRPVHGQGSGWPAKIRAQLVWHQ